VAELTTGTLDVTHPERDSGPMRVSARRLAYVVTTMLLCAIVGSAVLDGASEIDVWGESAETVADTGNGYVLEVRYPNVTRPALASPFDIVVRHRGGFDGPVEIAIDPDWIEIWDYQALYPEPSEATGEPGRLLLTFEPPDGEVLRIFFDARIQPAQQSARDGWVEVLDDSGDVAARVEFTTRVLP
jgi:hypothetical protein